MGKTKTLYVSDLDGTLLTSAQTLSDYTVKTINDLAKKGLSFSYATARSFVTSHKVTEGLSDNIPVIVYNGTFILENSTGRILMSNYFDRADALRIGELLCKTGIQPIVYAYIDGQEKYSYVPHLINRETYEFVQTRKDKRKTEVTEEHLYDGEIFHFSCIGDKDRLFEAYNLLKNEFECVCYKEMYSGHQWLEIQPKGANKANAVIKLKEMLGCDRLVVFGDGVNDISMFEVSDECYAVENAVDELKALSDGVIGGNNDDGVAKWLAENYKG